MTALQVKSIVIVQEDAHQSVKLVLIQSTTMFCMALNSGSMWLKKKKKEEVVNKELRIHNALE